MVPRPLVLLATLFPVFPHVSSQIEDGFVAGPGAVRLPSSAFAVSGTNATFDYIGKLHSSLHAA
jgi:hypothetical protein